MTKPSTDAAGVKQTWNALTKAGYTIVVVDGEGEEFTGQNRTDAVESVMTCDDGRFIVNEGEKYVGWVWFVFGNDPEEVVCDYTVNLSHVIDPLTEGWFD